MIDCNFLRDTDNDVHVLTNWWTCRTLCINNQPSNQSASQQTNIYSTHQHHITSHIVAAGLRNHPLSKQLTCFCWCDDSHFIISAYLWWFDMMIWYDDVVDDVIRWCVVDDVIRWCVVDDVLRWCCGWCDTMVLWMMWYDGVVDDVIWCALSRKHWLVIHLFRQYCLHLQQLYSIIKWWCLLLPSFTTKVAKPLHIQIHTYTYISL